MEQHDQNVEYNDTGYDPININDVIIRAAVMINYPLIVHMLIQNYDDNLLTGQGHSDEI
jgi:hypothetical protein